MKLLSAFILIICAVHVLNADYKVHAQAVKVVVDRDAMRSNETLCSGIAREVGNGFLHSGTTLSKKEYCRKILKTRMTFPASSCILNRMVMQCEEVKN
jgi:hypothetical protein